eukprot:Hpha_TRINITY_DN15833_c2_g8::TRINITY_DN15833_c2_g8_i1::g.187350::m.187350
MGGASTKLAGPTMAAVVRESSGMVFNPAYPRPPPPKAGGDEVLVRVRAAGINPVDYKVGKSMLGPIVGLDMAGIVEEVPEGSTGTLKVGDEVYGTAKGTLAEFVVAKGSSLGRKPEGLSFAEAGALPTAYITSLQALQKYGKYRKGARILVIGASGGCGLAAVQLAKQLEAGAIVAICSGRNAELCTSHGATEILDYTKPGFRETYASASEEDKFDIVYDAATGSGGGEDYKAWSLERLRKGGQYVAINGGGWDWLRMFTIGLPKDQHLFLTDMNTADLDRLTGLVAAGGAVKPLISSTVQLDGQAAVDEAFGQLKSRRTTGKIVFTVPE